MFSFLCSSRLTLKPTHRGEWVVISLAANRSQFESKSSRRRWVSTDAGSSDAVPPSGDPSADTSTAGGGTDSRLDQLRAELSSGRDPSRSPHGGYRVPTGEGYIGGYPNRQFFNNPKTTIRHKEDLSPRYKEHLESVGRIRGEGKEEKRNSDEALTKYIHLYIYILLCLSVFECSNGPPEGSSS